MKRKIQSLFSKLGATGFFHIFGSSTINKIINFASGIVIVRILSKSDYGVYSYANNILSFFLLLGSLGAFSGYLQLASETGDKDSRNQLYSYSCRVSFYSNLLIALLVLIVSLLIPLPLEHANFYLAIMALLPCFQYLYEMQFVYLRTELRNKEYGYANMFSTVLVFVLSCAFSYVFGAEGLIGGRYLAFLITFLFVLWRYRVGHPVFKSFRVNKTDKKAFWQISMISVLNNGLSRLMYLLDIFVLGIVVPNEDLIASYKVATNIPTALAFIPAALVTYIYPYFARNKDHKKWVKKHYLQLTVIMGVGTLIIAAIMVAFAPWIIRLVFGELYSDAVPCFRILSISFALSATFRILPGNILVTQRKLAFNLLVAVVSSLLNTGLNVIMIQKYESIGAALATLITVVVSGVLNVSYLLYTLRTTPDNPES